MLDNKVITIIIIIIIIYDNNCKNFHNSESAKEVFPKPYHENPRIAVKKIKAFPNFGISFEGLELI